MGRSVVFTVGKNGTNLPEDLATIAELLGAVPVSKGGPGRTPGPGVDDVMQAIVAFQKANMIVPADGTVTRESKTLFLLNQYGANDPDGTKAYIDSFRKRVVDTALANLGKVSDQYAANGVPISYYASMNPREKQKLINQGFAGVQDFRFGGDFLKQLYDDILLHPFNWRDTTTFDYKDKMGRVNNLTNIEGVLKRDMRVPLRNADKGGVHWCGMFAAWCWRQAGIDIKWRASLEPVVGLNPLPKRTDKENMRHGDIAFIKEQSHHYVIIDDPASTRPMQGLHTVDGNDMYQQIMGHKASDADMQHTFGHPQGFYSLEDAFSSTRKPSKSFQYK